MELVDELYGKLKAKGTQIMSRIIGDDEKSDVEGEGSEQKAEGASVSQQTESKNPAQQDEATQEVLEDKNDTKDEVSVNPVIDRVFQLRENFVIIGLTGRTGSGCTTVAEKLATKEWKELKSNYKDFNSQPIDNVVRKNRIVHRYLKDHWKQPFDVISASDIIFYYALKESFEDFPANVNFRITA